MKIGIFDSGLGGLIVARAIRQKMPEYDYVYLGDTKRVPYGNRSHEVVYEFTRQGVDYLFKKENCAIVIIACNTASARALRKIQQEYLPKNFPNRKVLGVLIPTAEECIGFDRIGVLATLGTVSSNTFPKEIKKVNKQAQVFQNGAPMLVPIAEEGERLLALPFIKKYLKPFLNKSRRKVGTPTESSGNIQALVLGCTHYPIFKNEIKKLLPKNVRIISQDEIIPKKFKKYLENHTEISSKLTKQRTVKILVTDITKNISKLSEKWFALSAGRQGKVKPSLVKI